MKISRNRIMVFRFSSMGDVAMTVPVIREFIEQNKDTEILFVSRKQYAPFFEGIPNLQYIGIDLENYKKITGLKKLAIFLLSYKPTQIADLHNVLRTKILRFFLSYKIKEIQSIDKGRKSRNAIIRKKNKVLQSIERVSDKYANVFKNFGYKLELSNKLLRDLTVQKEKKSIGIAPFAKYKEKLYPIEKMENICLELANQGYKVYLFGGGQHEIQILKKWETLNSNIISIAGKFNLKEELELIKKLELIITMDSSNMHLASIVGTRVISVWGGTHPYAGFLGYGQQLEDVVQITDLDCRPCSIYGNQKCFRKDWICMKNIQEQHIIDKVNKILSDK